MTDWGEEGIEAEAAELPLPTHAFGVDTDGLAVEVVDAAVQASVRKAVGQVATAAVEEALTPELMAALRERAAEAATAAVTEQVEANEAANEEPAEGAAGDVVEPTLYYGSVDEFVREYLRHVYRCPLGGGHRVWAARWWEYDEAVNRLEALWRTWEALRLDAATGMSVWWRDHADHHMPILMSPDGPFSTLDFDEMTAYEKGDPLPYEAPPADLFPDEREPEQPTET